MTTALSRVAHYNGKGEKERLAEAEAILTDWNNGLRPDQLVAKHGLSLATIYRRRDQALKARIAPVVDEYREASNAKLGDLMRRLEEQIAVADAAIRNAIATGNEPSAQKWLQLRGDWLERQRVVESDRRRLFGLDAPVRVDARVTVSTPVDDAVAALVAEVEEVAR